MSDKQTERQLEQIRRILIIQYKPFGDVLLNTAYLPALRRKFPGAVIDFLVQRPYSTILEDNPYIDNLILMEKRKGRTPAYYYERIRTIIRVRKLKYDTVIDQIRGPGSAQITFFSGAKLRLGWNKTRRWSRLKGYNWVYNYRAPRNNKIYYARAKFLVLAPLGIEETSDNIYYHVKPESEAYIDGWLNEAGLAGKRLVVFSPVTPVLRKQWALERFARTADMIKENTDCEIVLLWGPGEIGKVEIMASMMKSKAVIAPKTTFNQAGALLRRTFIYIGNDGGINHLAVSQDTPTIAVFGPKTDPLKWTAWHMPIHKYLRDFEFRDPEDNSFNITPEMVFGKFKELAARLDGGRGDKMKKVITYGTFDLFHIGHLNILRRARELGDHLTVAVSTDEFNRIKGKVCTYTYEDRTEIVRAIRYVDEVIPENGWEQKVGDIKTHEIDVFVMGDDWLGKFDFLKDHCEVVYLPRTEGVSTTIIRNRIKE